MGQAPVVAGQAAGLDDVRDKACDRCVEDQVPIGMPYRIEGNPPLLWFGKERPSDRRVAAPTPRLGRLWLDLRGWCIKSHPCNLQPCDFLRYRVLLGLEGAHAPARTRLKS